MEAFGMAITWRMGSQDGNYGDRCWNVGPRVRIGQRGSRPDPFMAELYGL